ncbi:phage portal protein [Paenibacillus anseongense]|uniref:phage portal protein n=1 Tax=Paenibacillus anseongense TaxID=2682845 RepID=UPI002DB59D50|nr:phage portal protein [Paenibacillus anseongense]MEC0269068.1 phage portal protein [Paenibacillus anseongense]
MKILERIIASVAPKVALSRAVAKKKLDVLNSGYSHHGASTSKKSMIGWNFGGGGPDEDIVLNLSTLRQRSRDLYMGGAALATGAIKTARTNIIGTGLKLKPAIDAEFLGLSPDEAADLKRIVEREFLLWAESVECDASRRDNFYELQQLACLSQLMSGDCLVLLPMVKRAGNTYDTRIRLIEADRCCDPPNKNGKDILGGVEVDEYNGVSAYWFVNQHPLGKQDKKKEWVRVEAFGKQTGRRNVLHLMESERPEQRRGVPVLAPVIESLKQLGRYTEAELMAAVVSGMFTVFIESETSDQPLGVMMDQEIDQVDPNSYELGNGAIVGLSPGEKISMANPGRPNTAFDGFVTSILRQVGAALEIPYELLVKNFTSSYSASRAALLEAWKMFRMRRSWVASDFCQPVYEEWFTEAVAKGRIPAPGFFDDPLYRKAYLKAEWHGPSAGQLDPLKEATAAKMRVEEGFSTRERETAELTGGDFEMNHRQRVREETMRREGGLLIEGSEKTNDNQQQLLDDDNK